MGREFKIERTTLDNGLTVVTDHVPETDLVHANLQFSGGHFHDFRRYDSNSLPSIMEQTHMNGRAHFAEHLVLHGHPLISEEAFYEQCREDALSHNFVTVSDYTRYFADGMKEGVFRFLDFVATSLAEKAYGHEHYLLEQRRIIDETRGYTRDPAWIDGFIMCRGRFKDNQVGGQWQAGLPETLAEISLRDLREWHDKTHVSDNATLFVSGNVNHGAICEMAFDLFSKLPRGRKFAEPFFNVPNRADYVQDTFYRPENVRAFVAFLTQGNQRDVAALQLFAAMARPHLKATVENTIGIYRFGIGAFDASPERCAMNFGFETSPENVSPAVTLTVKGLQETLERMSQPMFDTFKRQSVTSGHVQLARNWTNLEKRVELLQKGYNLMNDPSYYMKDLRFMEAVTLDDVKRVSKAALANCMEAGYIGKPGDYPTTSDIRDALGTGTKPPLAPGAGAPGNGLK